MHALNSSFWRDRSVFVTGHMGFKGTWLCYLLSRLGAVTFGYGQDDRNPLLYRELAINRHSSTAGDVSSYPVLATALASSGAEIVIHMAAQPLVLPSYNEPLRTFADNIMGTANLLEAVRHTPSVRAVVIVTSDKVYRNNEWVWAYREDEPLGGSDPYSASKAAAEIVTQSMISSFFTKPGTLRVASARAGNVIGGGDWADYRLLPDAARALSARRPLVVRNPTSTRPWQHVLEPLSGYLRLAQVLRESDEPTRPAWNFGPVHEDAVPVSDIANMFTETWGEGARWVLSEDAVSQPKEAHFLAVDSALARRDLGWLPKWRVGEAVARTATWYRDYARGEAPHKLLDRDIIAFLEN